MAYTYPEYRSFYVSSLGRRVVTSIGRRIGTMWPDVTGRHTLVIGYAEPWMDALAKGTASAMVAYPARMGAALCVANDGFNSTAMVDPLELPLPDSSFDAIFVGHTLEHVMDPTAFFNELWRVLSPGGQVLFMVPNRMSMWARSPRTPFDGGQPYSKGQLAHQLQKRSFAMVGEEWAVHFPPTQTPIISKALEVIEGATARLYPRFGGVLMVLAEKRVLEGRAKQSSKARLYAAQPVAVPKISH